MTYRHWLDTYPGICDEVRTIDAPNPNDAALGIWGVECLACGRATFYRHAGEMSHEEAAALTVHLRSHDEEPVERDDDGPYDEPRRKRHHDDPDIRDTVNAIRERPNFW